MFGLIIFILYICMTDGEIKNEGREYWYESARHILQRRLPVSKFPSEYPVRNVVVFVGDGMGLSTITAARILKGQRQGASGEEAHLTWDYFPAIALTKTFNADAQIGESSACATALMCGVKANYETLGVDSSVKFGDCAGSFHGRVPSLLSWAQDQGKQTGIVTTTRITHATPAALYAHSASRFWEDDSKIGVLSRASCKDIARQLVEDEPGVNLKVILGGGRRHFTSMATLDPEPPHKEGRRLDGRNLIEDWLRAKHRSGFNATYVTNKQQLQSVDVKKTDFLMGLFSSSHMDFEVDRDTSPNSDPSLTEMTVKALEVLVKAEHGYFLMVEGGRIDHAHHLNNAFRALDETLALDEAVQATLNIVDLNNTLVVVTADHSHVLVLGGYATVRGNSIFGFDRKRSDVEQKPYTTLLYSNGPGGIISDESEDDKISYKDIIQRAAVPRSWATHAGEDVPLFAIGRMASELFGGTIDQTYIPHAIAYGTCIGHFKNNCKDISTANEIITGNLRPFNKELINRQHVLKTISEHKNKNTIHNKFLVNKAYLDKSLHCLLKYIAFLIFYKYTLYIT